MPASLRLQQGCHQSKLINIGGAQILSPQMTTKTVMVIAMRKRVEEASLGAVAKAVGQELFWQSS